MTIPKYKGTFAPGDRVRVVFAGSPKWNQRAIVEAVHPDWASDERVEVFFDRVPWMFGEDDLESDG